MADDLLAELGLDVSDFEKAIDRLDNKVSSRFGNAMKTAADFLAKAFGIAAIGRYLYSLRYLSDEIDDVRAKMIAGSDASKDFNNSIQGAGGADGYFRRLGIGLDLLKIKSKVATAEIIQGWRLAIEDAGNYFSTSKFGRFIGLGKTVNSVHSEIADDQDTENRKKSILAREDELAQIRQGGLSTQGQQIELLEHELALEQLRYELAKKLGATGREAMNQAASNIGAKTLELAKLKSQRDIEVAGAKEANAIAMLQRQGYSEIATSSKTIYDLEQKRIQALLEGKYALAEQLQIAKDLVATQGAVAEHNMTPAQRRAERTAARKFARDTKKTMAHERDLAQRLANANPDGSDITPGSELDRYRQRRINAAQAAKNGSSNAIKDSAKAEKFYTQGLADLDAIKTNFDSAFQNR